VVESLGDRAIKSDNPIVSSKIDFADFLALIVKNKMIIGWQIELNVNERIINGKFSSFRYLKKWNYSFKWVEILFENIWYCDEWIISLIIIKRELTWRWGCKILKVYW